VKNVKETEGIGAMKAHNDKKDDFASF